MGVRIVSAAGLLVGSLVATTAAAQAKPPVAPAPPVSSGPRYHLLAQVDAHYSSNLYLEQTRRRSLFATEQSDGERYEGMEGPSDVVTTPGLEAGVAWKLGRGQKLGLALSAEYALHARNPIADYASLGAEARYAFGKRDRLVYRAELVPSRFKKNYAYDEAAGVRFFDRADYLQLDDELAYRHVFGKRWKAELGLGVGLRRFDAPFENRDYNAYTATLAAAYTPWKRLELELGVDVGLTRTPGDPEIDPAIPIDRSHHELEPHLDVAIDLPHGFAAGLGVALRLRTYDSSEPADAAHFDRHDRRLSLEVEASKAFGALSLAVYADATDSNAYRADPGADPNQYGYHEERLGLRVALRLD